MKWAVCVANDDHQASLEVRKLYRVLADRKGEALGMIRVIDESGEDYLYPGAMFETIAVAPPLERKLKRA
ncbi:hypothetical protein [Dongia sedimenti]|uniref:Uncharacterized protein n=1 Tax=Dongia sedimenti TaxID=3064282 RepID=A0ABU0YVU2_9PROT|nr:hypothetical protein [Rhodospirillaceae bacterium R-7]